MKFKHVAIGDLVDLSRGYNPPKSEFINEPREGYVRFIQIRDAKNDKNAVYVPESKKLRKAENDDILLVAYRHVGNAFRGMSGAINVALCRLRNKDEAKLLNDYLFYMIPTDYIKGELLRHSERSLIPSMSVKHLAEIKIPLPPLETQKQIVAKLDQAVADIGKAKVNAEQNLVNTKELFDSFLENLLENSDWPKKHLKDIVSENCSLSYGIVQPGDEYPEGLPIVRPTDLKSKSVDMEELKRIDPKKAESYKRTSLTGKELLLCVRGDTGVISMSNDELKGANVTRGIVPISFDNEIFDLQFGYLLFTSTLIQKQIKEKTYGAALMQINIRDLKLINVVIPPLVEQKKLEIKINTLKKEVDKLKIIYTAKIKALDELKQSILQKAFSGELT